MRPNTLREAYERISAGELRQKALAEFLDTFYRLRGPDAMAAAFAEPPALTGDARLDALAGAIAEYLSKRNGMPGPSWARAKQRYLREPWFTADFGGDAVKAYLWHSSPAEFRSRNIFTESQPLRRASQCVP